MPAAIADETVSPPQIEQETATNPAPKEYLNVRLLRKKSIIDYVGRNDKLQGNGAADSHIVMEIAAGNKKITELQLTSVTGFSSAWDTVPGNDAWLMAATSGKNILNNADGMISHPLSATPQTIDLWVQDNNSIASGKSRYTLKVFFDDGTSLESTVMDE